MKINWIGVCVHMTQGPDTEKIETKGIKAYHESKGWQDIGYNFVIEKADGGVWPVGGRPMNMPGAHAKYYNTKYIGVALAGDFTTVPPDEDHLVCAARFIAGMLDTIKAPAEGALVKHNDLNDTTCPGAAFPWERFKMMVMKYRTL